MYLQVKELLSSNYDKPEFYLDIFTTFYHLICRFGNNCRTSWEGILFEQEIIHRRHVKNIRQLSYVQRTRHRILPLCRRRGEVLPKQDERAL